MGEWSDDQISAWRTIHGDEQIPGSAEPIEGKCGTTLRNKNIRLVEDFLHVEWHTLPERYCARPAGQGTEHLGFGTCKTHLGRAPNHMKSYMPVAMKAELQTLADAYDESIGLDPAPVEAERIMLKNKRMFLAVERLVMELPDLVSTDERGVEKVAPIMELWLAINEWYSKWAQFALKFEIAERRVALEEAQAQGIANAIMGVIMDPQLQLTDAQLDLMRSNLSTAMDKLSPNLRPKWAEDLDADRIDDAEVMD